MKKTLLFFGAFAFALSASAQTIGAKAGLNYSMLSVSEGDNIPAGIEVETENPDAGIGFHVGGYAQIELSDNINLRPELLFGTRSVSSEDEFSTTILGITSTTMSESDQTWSYLNIPILAEYKVSENVGIHLGPSVGLLMAAKNEFSSTSTTTVGGSTTTTSTSGESTDTDGLNSLDLAIAVGAVLGLESGLNFGLRYGHSLTPVEEETDFSKSTWGVLGLSVGYDLVKN